MNTFKQPAFLIALGLFVLHQLLEKGAGVHIPLVDSYLDPLLYAPILLTFFLWERRVPLRAGPHYTLRGIDVAAAVVFLAVVSEIIFP